MIIVLCGSKIVKEHCDNYLTHFGHLRRLLFLLFARGRRRFDNVRRFHYMTDDTVIDGIIIDDGLVIDHIVDRLTDVVDHIVAVVETVVAVLKHEIRVVAVGNA